MIAPRPTSDVASGPPRWVGEGLLLTVASLLLVWLSRRPRGAEPLPGALLGPWVSVVAALLVAGGVPGYVLWRMMGQRNREGLPTLALSGGLGLAWLLFWSSLALVSRSSIGGLTAWVTVANVTLVAAYVAWRATARGPAESPGPTRAGGWSAGRKPLVLAGIAFVALLAVAANARGFTFNGDEWFLLRSTRYLLEASSIDPAVTGTRFEAWNLAVALVVKLAGVDLVQAWREILPPLLLLAAAICHLALGRALFGNTGLAAFAFAIQALWCLSDMHTRGEGAGMAMVVRIVEDKYACLSLAVPLVQVAFVSFVRCGRPDMLAVSAILALAAVLLHPLALLWLGLSLGGFYAATVATRRIRGRDALWLALLAMAALALGWTLRSLRPQELFQLRAPTWALNPRLLELTHRQVVILSPEEEWIVGHPALVAHPLTLSALLAAISLLPRLRRSMAAQFLFCATALPLAVVYNPLGATWLSRWISPWMVHRLLWALPVSYVLAYALRRPISALERWVRGRRFRHAPSISGGLLAMGVVAVLLAPRIVRSLAALRARNHVWVTPGEKELLYALAADPRLGGTVLAPPEVSIHLGAWSSRFVTLPGPDTFRMANTEVLEHTRRFLRARRIDETEAALLQGMRASYVVARAGSKLDHAMGSLPPAFVPLFRGGEFVLYGWRAELWPLARRAATAEVRAPPLR